MHERTVGARALDRETLRLREVEADRTGVRAGREPEAVGYGRALSQVGSKRGAQGAVRLQHRAVRASAPVAAVDINALSYLRGAALDRDALARQERVCAQVERRRLDADLAVRIVQLEVVGRRAAEDLALARALVPEHDEPVPRRVPF